MVYKITYVLLAWLILYYIAYNVSYRSNTIGELKLLEAQVDKVIMESRMSRHRINKILDGYIATR